MSENMRVAAAIRESIREDRIARVTVRDIWDALDAIDIISDDGYEHVDTGLDSIEVWSTDGPGWMIELVQEGGRKDEN